MAQIILKNNICWDQALLKQVQRYQRDGTVPWLVDKKFSVIASAATLDPSSKVTFTNKDTIYEILPYEDIGEQLDSKWLTQCWLSKAEIVSTNSSKPSIC